MTRRILALVLVLALACAMAVTGYADGETTVTYTGSALEFTGGAGETPTMVMDDMLPGVTSVGEMTLINGSGALARFYMSTEVTQTLEGTQNSGYVVKMWVEGPDGTTVLFGNDGVGDDGVQVGGNSGDNTGNKELLEMNDMLAKAGNEGAPQDYLLVANLDKGESAVLKLSITPNGTATTNEYGAKVGNINFKFMAETVDIKSKTEVNTVKGEDVVVTQTRYWLNGVQTGDPMSIAPLVGVVVVALLVFIVAAKKRKEREE